MNPEAERFFEKTGNWSEEMNKLRKIVLDCGLTEDFKWKHPCYTYQGNNIVLIHGFKEYCALLFFKGALLNDPGGMLVRQTQNVQAARQLRFTNPGEINEPVIKKFVFEAIGVEKAGLKVEMKKTKEYDIPEEFRTFLDNVPSLKRAFESLTPGRQRGYILYFSGAKRSETRKNRIKKCIPKILAGKGLND